ncbi:hypothetical protein OIV83_003317 [Microbotryomycetes sp. JL201]|nr:hypothetical protein OIV83_003317 [Microbotryomycetes sp. JL201]
MVSTTLRRVWRAYSVASKARRSRPRIPAVNAQQATSPTDSHTAWDRLKAAQEQAQANQTAKSKVATQQSYDLSRAASWTDPPLVSKARAKTTRQRSIWESYLVMPAETRLKLSLALFAFGLIGLYGGDYLVPPADKQDQPLPSSAA